MKNKEILLEGISYLEKLDKINPETSKLGSEVIYNFVSLGVESVLTGVLMDYNKMVDHSGILMMLRELQTVEEVELSWIDAARFMNKFQSYCSLEPIPVKIPTNLDLVKIIDFGKEVGDYAKQKIGA